MSLRFEDLVLDVQVLIVTQFLSKADLLSLARVSRHSHKIATPVIYACVSLLLRITELPIQWTQQEDDREELLAAQCRLLRTLNAHPEVSDHVQTLEWTIQPLSRVSDWEYEPLAKEEVSTLDELFNIWLPMFRNAKRILLDINTDYIPASVPTPLFPCVTSVKLADRTSLEMVKSVLHTPEQITELSIYTLTFHEEDVAVLEWIEGTNFPSLRKLSLRYGHATEHVVKGHISEEETIFPKWKKILLSSRETLHHVLLGVKRAMPSCRVIADLPGFAPEPENTLVYMVDAVFTDISWPELLELELEGVKAYPGLYNAMEEAVPRLVLSHEKRLIIEAWDPVQPAKF